jgi:hypothetical protein
MPQLDGLQTYNGALMPPIVKNGESKIEHAWL